MEKFPTQDQNAKSAAFSLIHLYVRVNEQVWYTIFKCHWVLYILKVWFSIFNRDISCRTFSTAKFISDHKNNLTPAGLCFFQATWDESVTQTYMENLGMVSFLVFIECRIYSVYKVCMLTNLSHVDLKGISTPMSHQTF